MTTPMTTAGAYLILIDALILARERVTADTIAEKQAKRDRFKSTVSRMHLADEGDDSQRPTAKELRELLGDPGDAEIRRALEAWG
jgi:hypothetical protein